MDNGETVQRWGYSTKDGTPKKFELEPDQDLPRGYVDTPAKVKGTKSYEDRQADDKRVAKLEGKKKPRKAKAKAQPARSANADDGQDTNPNVSTPPSPPPVLD